MALESHAEYHKKEYQTISSNP